MAELRLIGLRRTAGGIRLSWASGREDFLSVYALRVACPCAFCVDELTGKRRLDPGSVPQGIELVDMQPVGRYAYRLLFGDGHDSGIYTLEHLDRLGAREGATG